MNDFKDWVSDVEIAETLGNGWCVRIEGSDVFDDINRYGVKTRRTFSIAKGLTSEKEARGVARNWLESQISRLEATEA
ncbi:hypothetical protein NVP1271B_37 [Vibrio phage 1.271.B._10N.286.54.B4]|nr:hypothetical protein NVP1027O_37 [Vibrio phage 1.027.O._10N.286.54.B8]AUR91391.1 hypothetical protein NVP1160O_42 [Vibrio phage 1.160.O._10N.261.48.B11]AUR92364.1 hypothetical protein NVP1171O_37 [Vibrio phage 1.171.O._10N.261.52.F12]AUR94417.1 hypothetical protein NVP1194O_37 [Vibrio phage 1.194.O._10N.286.54.B1]AUR94590.1 hypothetical protein NVP1196O_37 [Vibrio phage 1.196.O._10N.286.54.E12]AUR95057.1 hypothetical protein NVP1200O_37 [Vibrio phage 1.200.O._10N.286.55.E1]AUR99545.1 hypot